MSDAFDTALAALTEKFTDDVRADFGSSVKFDIEGEGAIIADADSVRAAGADDEADVTLSAELEIFEDIFNGDLDPTSAFMGGKLKIDGDMGAAMRLASSL